MRARRAKSALVSAAIVASAAFSAVGIGLVSSASAASKSKPAIAKGSGDVDVISAGSLQTLMTKIAPAFKAATGYTLVDTSGGSSCDAADIKV